MQDGFYKTRLKDVSGQSRRETVLSYLMTTLWENTEFWGKDNTEECHINIGRWAWNISKTMSRSSFDVVVKIKDDDVVEFWYVDKMGTIKKVFG